MSDDDTPDWDDDRGLKDNNDEMDFDESFTELGYQRWVTKNLHKWGGLGIFAIEYDENGDIDGFSMEYPIDDEEWWAQLEA